MTEWTPERIAEYRALTSLDDVLSMLDEIERLQARDQRREKLLRDVLPCIAHRKWAQEIGDLIRAELADGA